MAEENKGVVLSPTGMKASQLFFGTTADSKGPTFSGTHNLFRAATAPPNQNRNTGVECPVCKEEGVLQNPFISNQDGLRCNMGHKFKDTDDLMSRPHNMVPVELPTAVQENYVTVNFQIPSGVLSALQTKYGGNQEKMRASFTALARALTAANTLILGEIELKRLSDAVGQPITNPAQLFGVITAKQKEIDELKESVKGQPEGQREAGGTMLRRGELVLWFNPDNTKQLTERAGANNVRLEEFLESFVGQAIENNWF